MFGLIRSTDLDATASNNVRREVFNLHPTGAFPLMGLLSMAETTDHTVHQTFGWQEERYVYPKSKTAQANAAGAFTDTSGASGAVGVDLTAAGWSQVVGDVIRVKVADASQFRVRDAIWIKDVPGTASSVKDIRAIVDAVYTTPNTIDIRFIEDVTNVLNSAAVNDLWVTMVGIITTEGGYSKKGGVVFPTKVFNNTQIFRTPVGPLTRNAVKKGQDYNKSGVYVRAAKQAHVRHMTAMEQALFWGILGDQMKVDPDDGEEKPEYYFGGIHWALRMWEKGTTANGADVNRRPAGSADLTSLAWNADDDKRVLKFSGGSITKEEFNSIIQRAFSKSGDGSWEKLVVCGNGLMAVINNFFEANSIKVVQINSKEDTYGMQLTVWETVFGTLYFKTHPLMTDHPLHTYSGFIVDVGSIRYVPFEDSDTELLQGRSRNDYDGIKHEWLTEFGPELRFPERHIYLENLRGITA